MDFTIWRWFRYRGLRSNAAPSSTAAAIALAHLTTKRRCPGILVSHNRRIGSARGVVAKCLHLSETFRQRKMCPDGAEHSLPEEHIPLEKATERRGSEAN
jgi:hypothetical protein